MSFNTLFVDGILYGDSRVIGKRIRRDGDGILTFRAISQTKTEQVSMS